MTSVSKNEFVSLAGIKQLIQDEESTPEEAVEAFLNRIEERDGTINAYTDVYAEEARTTAQQQATKDDGGLLHGVPIALKDLGMARTGDVITSGSQLMASIGEPAEKTSAVVKRLEAAGAIVLGRTNTPEFGYGGVTNNDLYGPTASPINTDYNAGGSSGGAAAAVAAGMAPAALGSDMGGSVRIPAAACGIFGMKASPGVLPSDDRPNAFGSEAPLQVAYGPLTRSVEDAAVLFEVMAGQHPRDPASVPVDFDFTGTINRSVDDLRIAYTPDLGIFDVDAGVEMVTSEAVAALTTAGATVERASFDHGLAFEDVEEAFLSALGDTALSSVEVLRQAEEFDVRDHTEHISDAALQALEWGEETTREDLGRVNLVRTAFFDALQDVFETYDAIATPTLGTTGMERDSEQYLAFEKALTWPFNLTGHPAASVPAGLTDEETPAGLQIVAPLYDDAVVLATSAALERERPWTHLYNEASVE